MRSTGNAPEKLARQETCAVRQKAFSKVHNNFVTVKTPLRLHDKPVRFLHAQAMGDAPKEATIGEKTMRQDCTARVQNAAQIIGISVSLVTKKDVTVAPEKRRQQATRDARKSAPRLAIAEAIRSLDIPPY